MSKTARKVEEREREREALANSESSASEQLPGKHNLREIAVTDEYMPSRRTSVPVICHISTSFHS